MSTVSRSRWPLPAISLGLGAAACVACCTIPLLGLSIGAGGLGALVALGEPIAFGLVAVGVVLAAVALRRRSGKRQASCADTGACSIDGARGCRAPGARTPDRHDPSDGRAARWTTTAPEAGRPMLDRLHGVSDGPTSPSAPPPRPTA
ncbi:hypothetical protein [Sorangium sp. So ce854]|uniref:hypothetical protein n=1 Tax=Sorangium sp. So ce854 TaxID=3133322 RepID=UPI003F5E679A